VSARRSTRSLAGPGKRRAAATGRPVSAGEVFSSAMLARLGLEGAGALGANGAGRRVRDLRHMFATWALSTGVPPKSVSGMPPGRRSADLTPDPYGHYLPTSELQTGSALLNAFLGADPVPNKRSNQNKKRVTARV
jgi:integrase